MKSRILAVLAAILPLVCACNLYDADEFECIDSPLEVRATAPGYLEESRTSYDFDGLTMMSEWLVKDRISVVPGGKSAYLRHYMAKSSGKSATFKLIRGDKSVTNSSYIIYYPGGYPGLDSKANIYNDWSYSNFAFEGQVQSKSKPTEHIAKYHTMRLVSSNDEDFDFSKGRQASCMHMLLAGKLFTNPSSISITLVRDGMPCPQLPLNNQADGMIADNAQYPVKEKNGATISLGLSGYKSENCLEAYMMMPDRDVRLLSGDKLRVVVSCSDGDYFSELSIGSDITLTGGHCHNLVIRGGWQLQGDDPFYERKIVWLQKGNENLNFVLMGDGYTCEDIESGVYDSDMRRFAGYLFNIEPYASLSEDFSVCYVIASSKTHLNATNQTNGAINNPDADTRFSTSFNSGSTLISANRTLVSNYAHPAFSSSFAENNATVIMIANQECRSGTCYIPGHSTGDYGYGKCVALLSKGRSKLEGEQLLHHEVLGHGFGKLADEYTGKNGGSSEDAKLHLWRDKYHCYRNVDVYTENKYDCYWGDMFDTINDYEGTENLGIYLGGLTYNDYFGRPTYNASESIMNKNTGRFNAICRRVIYYRYKCLAGLDNGWSWKSKEELQDFLRWDAETMARSALSNTGTISRLALPLDPDVAPSTPPVLEPMD